MLVFSATNALWRSGSTEELSLLLVPNQVDLTLARLKTSRQWLCENFARLPLLLHILHFTALFKLINVSIGLLSWSMAALHVQERLAALAGLKLVYSHLGEVA